MSMLKIAGLTFGYGEERVFSDLNLEMEEGEIFCLVGPNGCGKTTLQHCILNLLKPSQGKIMVDGRSLEDYKERELAGKMAYVPQSHTPSFPYLVEDVVAMGSLRHRSFFSSYEKASRDKARFFLDYLGIGQLGQVPYTSLSGGQLQLVMIARALCQESKLLILDEPTAHLDIGRSQDILAIISRLNKDQGISILMATHDFNQPLFFADQGNPVRMALMNQGKISQVASPMELFESGAPENLYGVRCRVLELEADRKRHYLAAWKE